MPLIMYKFLLVTSIFLIVSGLILTAFSIFSPLWEVVDFPRSHLSHHHGLWWDCIVHHETLIPLHEVQAEIRGDRCDSKMDSSVQAMLRVALEKGDAEARELLLHRFLPHHKGVIFFAVFTFVFGLISILIGSCSPCFPPNALLYVVGVFMTGACSLLADIIYIFAFNQKPIFVKDQPDPHQDITLSRRERGSIGPIYKRLGIATYIHMFGSMLLVAAFIFSIFCAYFLITSKHAHDVCCTSRKEYREQNKWRNSGLILKTGRITHQSHRPFVVIDDDSSI
uniref:Clc-like protein n=2 Tax=Caenorhabditis tropicalis TaxID=1561998 RepID=A0A1I7TFF0_9PELO